MKPGDILQFEVYDKVVSDSTFLGTVEKQVWQLICESGEKYEVTYPLRAQGLFVCLFWDFFFTGVSARVDEITKMRMWL